MQQMTAVRVEFFGDEIDRITEIDALTGECEGADWSMWLFSRHHIMLLHQGEDGDGDMMHIEEELKERVE